MDVLLQSQDIETAEIGSFFVSRSGVMTFLNRLNRIAQFKREMKMKEGKEDDEDPKTPYNDLTEEEQALLEQQDLE